MTSSIYIPRAVDSSSYSAGLLHLQLPTPHLPTATPPPSLPSHFLQIPLLLPLPLGPSDPSLTLTSKFHRVKLVPHSSGLTKQIFLPPPGDGTNFPRALLDPAVPPFVWHSSSCLLQTGFILLPSMGFWSWSPHMVLLRASVSKDSLENNIYPVLWFVSKGWIFAGKLQWV